jgi:GST-like protein
MMTLFSSTGSGAAAVELALEAIGAPYRTVRASSWEPDSALAELERVNPLKQIPTLVLDDGSVLTESAAILIHLGLAHPDAHLLPSDASARAQSIRGLVYIAANCYSAISIIDYPERWCASLDEATRQRIIQGTRERLHVHWDIFADQFRATPFFNGQKPGALDFLAVVVSKWAGTRGHVRAARPDFHAALERIESEPGVARVLQRHWPPA